MSLVGVLLRTFQVPEDAVEEGKLSYTTLKHVIWHESFKKLLLEIEQYSKTGYTHTSSHDNITHWLFPGLMILSANFEEMQYTFFFLLELAILTQWPTIDA
ncbi:hypothetical protein M404DRAFT_35575 [Pisolithus tinctorius Marx 270]|uniref:Uncharacterized protein n=1 Tax=Pisolithus tinctorius Marx 270 TaxID=870435 RepID=A0A0C3IA26_PISTI|nr:hypothetical protein M404DRAFT_35575 [Pisolithus tinctorius Marx 270]